MNILEVKPLQKKGPFKPWTTTIEVKGVNDTPMRVHIRSYLKPSLENSIQRIARIAHKTQATGPDVLHNPVFSLSRKSGLFVSYQITPVTT